jgi:hypothetical protein
MKLLSFRVRQFRSIRDSGTVNLAFSKTEAGEDRSLTALVGRNESGKSNLLLALQTLKPDGGVQPLTMIKDFPRDRHPSEWNPGFAFLQTTWSLDDEEHQELVRLSSAYATAHTANISRDYAGKFYIGFDVDPPQFDAAAYAGHIRKVLPALKGMAKNIEAEEDRAKLNAALEALASRTAPAGTDAVWCKELVADISSICDAIGEAGKVPSDDIDALLAAIEDAANVVAGYEDAAAKARTYARSRIPTFIYVSDFPEISGHQNIEELLYKPHPGHSPGIKRDEFSEGQLNFLKMAKVAGFDPEELYKLGTKGHEERPQLLNRAGAVISSRLRDRWKDRPLKVFCGWLSHCKS